MSRKIGMMSLGCPKNQCDAELMLGRLRDAGFELVEDVAKADCAIVNTCGFIASAQLESIEEIVELGRLKADGDIKAIVVTGCMAERQREAILEELPEVDAVVGIGGNADIVRVCERVLAGERFSLFGDKEELPLEGARIQTTPPFYAYLRIADGCDNRCSYCAIPSIRGGFRSRKQEDIIAEARDLARRGVKELIVIAQDTTRYGEDLYGEKKLPELLRSLCAVDGIEWIRLLYCYPDRVTDELLDCIREEDKIVNYMDIPVQHCNGDVLRAMNRRGDRESLSAIIAHIREKVPGIVLRTTIMVGFPGETEEQFEELCGFVRDTAFERLGCFVFSAEEGTPAYTMEGQIDEETAERRMEVIMDEQSRNIDNWCDMMNDNVIDVVAEGYDRLAGCCFGRSKLDAPEIDGKVFFSSKKPMNAGDIVKVRVTGHIDCDLTGERTEE